MKVSIIINNFNYSAYLAHAIESALSQDYEMIEVIVVDDGSTDDSLIIAKRYKERIKIVAKDNGGQASAFNAGFATSTGSWILFLDADDWLESNAISTAARFFPENPGKIHFRLREFRQDKNTYGNLMPSEPLSHGDVATEIMERGGYVWPPTSGNIFSRERMQKYLPIPEADFRLCADIYLCLNAAFSGPVIAINEILGNYRLHGNNNYAAFKMEAIYLYRRAYYALITKALLAKLMPGRNCHPEFTSVKECPDIETVLLGIRFGGLEIEQFGLSVKELKRRWWSSKRSGNSGVRVPVWLVFCCGPAFLVSWVMKLRALKANRHSRLQSARQLS